MEEADLNSNPSCIMILDIFSESLSFVSNTNRLHWSSGVVAPILSCMHLYFFCTVIPYIVYRLIFIFSLKPFTNIILDDIFISFLLTFLLILTLYSFVVVLPSFDLCPWVFHFSIVRIFHIIFLSLSIRLQILSHFPARFFIFFFYL